MRFSASGTNRRVRRLSKTALSMDGWNAEIEVFHALAHRQVRQLGVRIDGRRTSGLQFRIDEAVNNVLRCQLLAGTVLQHGISDLVGGVELQFEKVLMQPFERFVAQSHPPMKRS